MKKGFSWAGLTAFLLVLVVAGCKEKEGAPAAGAEAEPVREPVRERSSKEAPQEYEPVPEQKKKSIIGRMFSSDTTTPPYGWDGHASTYTYNISADAAYNRALDAMKNMNFTVDERESRRDQWRIVASGADKTTVHIFMQPITGGTAVKVKVGTLGERTGGERILDEISHSLKRIPVRKVKVVEPEQGSAK